jgi:hypothetical protein
MVPWCYLWWFVDRGGGCGAGEVEALSKAPVLGTRSRRGGEAHTIVAVLADVELYKGGPCTIARAGTSRMKTTCGGSVEFDLTPPALNGEWCSN